VTYNVFGGTLNLALSICLTVAEVVLLQIDFHWSQRWHSFLWRPS